MSAFGYGILIVILASGASAIVVNRPVIRRWVVALYLFFMLDLAFGVFIAGPRLALSVVEDSGGKWTSEKAVGAIAMHQASLVPVGLLLLMGVLLAVLVIRRPK